MGAKQPGKLRLRGDIFDCDVGKRGRSAAMAGAIAIWIIVGTAREVFQSHQELIWPEKMVCGHSDHEEASAQSG